MPKFVSIETGNICGASRPANTPRQACSLDCIAKLRFAFQPASLVDRHLKKAAAASTPRQAFFTEHNTFRSPFHPSRRQPATAFRRISFHTSPHNLTLARNLHSGLTGQHASALIFSLSFFSSILLHAKKNRGKPAKPILLYFSYNPESSPNLVQAFPSQSLSLLFSPSNQYTLLHRPRSGHT